ncbi:site-2 protease family protein, partial [Photobacterium japonica]|uniref:site-2 protease family protein n=1 Tax=Photobacterium japonica TaxID=2910235 RepID=UPI003D14E3FC
MTAFILSFAAITLFHCLSMALTAHLFGIRVMSISVGYGPRIIDQKRFTLKLLPIAGCVQMLDSRMFPLSKADYPHAFDHQSRWVRAAIPLLSWLPLLTIASVALGIDTINQVGVGIYQVLLGARHPIMVGQGLIESAMNAVQQNSPFVVFALVATKLCAVNILPLTSLNGGQTLMELLSPPEFIVNWLYRASVLISLLLILGWVGALMIYVG